MNATIPIPEASARPKSSAFASAGNKLRTSHGPSRSIRAGWMVNPGFGAFTSTNLSLEHGADERDEIPVRTNFTKVILNTYSRDFNLSRERHRTMQMVSLSRESRERVDGGLAHLTFPRRSQETSISNYNSRNKKK